jgi:hypothetical protein
MEVLRNVLKVDPNLWEELSIMILPLDDIISIVFLSRLGLRFISTRSLKFSLQLSGFSLSPIELSQSVIKSLVCGSSLNCSMWYMVSMFGMVCSWSLMADYGSRGRS